MGIEARVLDLIRETFGLPAGSVTPNSRFGDLGFESIDDYGLVVAAEREFGIQLPREDFQGLDFRLLSVSWFITYLKDRVP